MGSHEHAPLAMPGVVGVILAAPFAVAAVVYLVAATGQAHRGRRWPRHRTLLWVAGLSVAASGFVGPLADAAHQGFIAHTAAHLLVGMLAPLLLVLSAPMTLALRALAVVPARRLSRLLRSPVARILTHPAVAALLNVGGMWVLYRTPVYELTQTSWLLHMLVMLHFLLTGYLYTASLIGVDPSPHRASFAVRAGVLGVSLAAHGVLAKMLYATAPPGVADGDARLGAQLMFYGGDAIDFVLIVVLCAEWYRVTGRMLEREHAGLAAAHRGEAR